MDTWKKLPENIQNLLIESAKEDERNTIKRAEEYIPRENAELKKMGVEFLSLPQADAEKMRAAAVSALWEVVIKRDPENGPKFKEMISR
jgi:TRAP-type C4-dicarboxylate transport system substrate-binding protein